MDFNDVLYGVRNGVAWIVIDRPDKTNAFRGTTCDDLVGALSKAGYDKVVGAIVWAGVGDRAFCAGGEAVAMGLVNVGVPHDQFDAEVQRWGEELCERSPTAIAIAKRSFTMDTVHQAGIASAAIYALELNYDTEELRVGVNALKEKCKPDFRKHVK